MSSPDGLHSDFLARWMPSSARAGVILSPCPDLAASLRHIPRSLGPNDSFTSDFAPLPASVDSSCVCVDGSARLSGGARPGTDGEIESPEEMASETHLSVMMKLDQLRKWQQHMQEELKAHQLEELLCLQEEQQRLLGMISGSQHCTEKSSGLLGADWGEDALKAASYHRGSLHSPTITRHGQTQASTCGLQQEQDVISTERQRCLSRGHSSDVEDSDGEGLWDSRDDGQDQDVDATLIPYRGAALVEESDGKDDNALHDRPIKPGICGQKQTFEELLEEQLKLEEQRLKSIKQQQQQSADSIPKRAFLKRGEGLSRFTNRKPAAISKGDTNGTRRLPVQRKIAILNKENRLKGCSSAPQDIRVENKATRTKVLGIHQRRNPEESAQTYTEGRQTKQYPTHQSGEQNSRKAGSAVEIVKQTGSHNMELNPVSVLEGTSKTDSIPIRKKSSDSGVESPEGVKDGGGFPQDSFELQENLWRECNSRLESMEQGEFELLEQAAEELSFSSNSSFVLKFLQMDRELQVAKGRHQRRLSSTPIKSRPSAAPQRHSGGTACNEIGSSSEDSDSQIRDGMLKSKVGFDDKKQQDRERNDRHDHSDVSSCGESESDDQNTAVNPLSVPSTLCFPVQSNPPYDKRSYQDDNSCRDSASDVTQGDDAESDGVLSNTDNDTLIEDNDGQQGRIVFDDDDTWNDLEEAAGTGSDSGGVGAVSKATGSRSSPPERTLVRKVAVSKVAGTATLTNQEPDPPSPPPSSQLMTKLFPSLKPKVQNTPVAVSSAAGESRKAEEEAGQHVQSQQLRLRLAELEIEIERFKKENAALHKLRQENEKQQESLRKERVEFEQMRTEELSKFEEYKKEENRKMQKERKLFEKHVSAARAIPDKKEREEIQVLKQQLSSLQEELKRRESRWASTHSRLRQQIDSLNQDNSSLRDEVSMLEKLRLSTWRKISMDAEKDKEGKDKTAVTKGVKFASPLASRSSSSSPPQVSSAAVPKGSSKENGQGPAGSGMKSSLRKPAASDSSSSSVPVKRKDDKSTPSAKTEENPNQDPSLNSSPKTDSSSSEVTELESLQEVITHPDGKVEKVLSGGNRLIIFPNGTRKELSADGQTMKVTFFNGDTKEITADQRVIYFYSGTQTTHITYPDGVEVLHFPNNQTEKHFPDGRKEITYPDQTVKNLFPNGKEESVLSDGTIIQVNPDGSKEIHFNTGQKEIHTPEYKSREYPDGTVKTVFSDGRQETHYPTGRVRVKDKDGNIILDNRP